MKGDFSRWDKLHNQNFAAVLHQQGRVLLDRDWNDQARLDMRWQERAGRDIIGSRVLAVPADHPGSFMVTHAAVTGGVVRLDVQPGYAWADGLAVSLVEDPLAPGAPVSRQADYLGLPFQNPPVDPDSLGAGSRDAVVLEVWREALNAFQVPDLLIEPALGGPDTTERAYYAMRFRLLRLLAGESCESVAGLVQDNPALKGKLRASLLPTTVISGDCPVVEGGGYVGFEHFLYRMEIGRANAAGVFFKWSQFNGGLVGRGECDLGGPTKKITLTANDQAIKTAGLPGFYLEVVEFDAGRGFWRVTYGADVTLNDDELLVQTERYTEPNRPTGRVFFRLWNELRPITDFPRATAPASPTELRDGIRLEFDADNGSNYQEGDYWTFPVRAGEIGNPDPLVDNLPPEGIRYHRVPLAILDWNAALDIHADNQEIEDCRDVFNPLTRASGCCSFRVGDGKASFGDFNSIEEALRRLPAAGGEICLLPGLHRANAVIAGRVNIKISGCEGRSVMVPRTGATQQPIFTVKDSTGIILEGLDLVTLDGTAVDLVGSQPGLLREVEVRYNRILAFRNAIHALQGQAIAIHHNRIRMLDKEGGDVAIFILADDSRVERNELTVVAAGTVPPGEPGQPGEGGQPDPGDPCQDPEIFYINPVFITRYANAVWRVALAAFIPANPYQTLGGIQVGSGSERLALVENVVNGGAGNGITLGSDLEAGDIPGGEVPPAKEFQIEARQGLIWGGVFLGDQGQSGVTVLLTRTTALSSAGAEPVSAVTDASGTFLAKTGDGVFTVSIASRALTITAVEPTESPEFGVFNRISVEPSQAGGSLLDALAFIYDIAITGNEIANMGLSGVGVPALDLRKLVEIAKGSTNTLSPGLLLLLAALFRRFGVLNGFVVGLTIQENHIDHCWQAVLDDVLQARVLLRGLGGISLGFCQDVQIGENRIEDNGRNQIAPTCGIFITYAEQAEISHNQVLNNGPVDAQAGAQLQPGIRGGIVIRLAMARSLVDLLGPRLSTGTGANSTGFTTSAVFTNRVFAAAASRAGSLLKGRIAARIHDNLVEQPVGRALQLAAFGPLSVLDNQLNTDFSGLAQMDPIAGAVLIANLGRSIFTVAGSQFSTSTGAAATAAAALQLPNGNVLFNNNQTALGFAGTCLTSQVILSGDDIGFDGNQSDILLAPVLRINTLLLAPTVRASDNRLKEPLTRG